ncbi:MAG: hypothetical protein PHI31_03490 [Desulfuromonadaceae bacterium]|nr:hypothetical protein [Desulfuromonadaceae bacterium]
MRRPPRCIPALVLVILYVMMVISPFAPIALQSAVIAHALTGECASDCSICGCSTERSANHTCCCWQKKIQAAHAEEQEQPECCKKSQTGQKRIKAIISSRPCGSGKTAALVGVGHGDVFPYFFNADSPVVLESPLITRNPTRQIDWLGEPPDQPPKISCRT